ncbi:hypothetical protein G6F22_020376 [Rhizopus arrhizus]|nr:hypothetical protein G6F22_020376 [Rhizopus arrhizus]KAG1252964.1 hypothetical protein G6F66_015160 [Rhizopus arrhizus]
MHGEHIGVAGRPANVAALQRRGGRQHDVCPARQRRPPGFMHDHRFGLAPGLPEPVLVLVMVERIAARPIDQLHVRIGSWAPALPAPALAGAAARCR